MEKQQFIVMVALVELVNNINLKLLSIILIYYIKYIMLAMFICCYLIYAKNFTANQAIYYVLLRRANSLRNKFQ
jgi:hypothetical protein